MSGERWTVEVRHRGICDWAWRVIDNSGHPSTHARGTAATQRRAIRKARAAVPLIVTVSE